MEIRLLGPIEASRRRPAVALGPLQQRAVLAMLALHVNHTVSTDRLIEGLRDERAPPSAHKLVQLYVSHLRKPPTGARPRSSLVGAATSSDSRPIGSTRPV